MQGKIGNKLRVQRAEYTAMFKEKQMKAMELKMKAMELKMEDMKALKLLNKDLTS